MIKMTKNVAATLMAIMLLAQIGLAHHSTVHFTDHSHYEQADEERNNHGKQAQESCQICLVVKSLSLGLIGDDVSVSPAVTVNSKIAENYNNTINRNIRLSYNPRAPPVFLI